MKQRSSNKQMRAFVKRHTFLSFRRAIHRKSVSAGLTFIHFSEQEHILVTIKTQITYDIILYIITNIYIFTGICKGY